MMQNTTVVDAIVLQGLAKSKTRARMQMTVGNVFVNNWRVYDIAATLEAGDVVTIRTNDVEYEFEWSGK